MENNQDSKAEIKASENKEQELKLPEMEVHSDAEEGDDSDRNSCCRCGEDDEDSIDWQKLQDGRVVWFCFPCRSRYYKGEISESDIEGNIISG